MVQICFQVVNFGNKIEGEQVIREIEYFFKFFVLEFFFIKFFYDIGMEIISFQVVCNDLWEDK